MTGRRTQLLPLNVLLSLVAIAAGAAAVLIVTLFTVHALD
jgi:hypothetical protein